VETSQVNMRRRIIKTLVSLFISMFFFCGLALLLNSPMGSSILGVIANAPLFVIHPLSILIYIFIISAIFFANVHQLIGNRFSALFIRIEVIVYLFALFAAVMLKSRGLQSFNLNILDLYIQLSRFPLTVVLNVLIFVPLGALTFKYIKSPRKAFPFALALILVIEALQYFLHLGVADIVDVVANMLGFALGYMPVCIMKKKGFSVDIIDRRHFKITFPQKPVIEVETSTHKTGRLSGLKARIGEKGSADRMLAITTVSVLAVVLLFGIGYIWFEPDEYLSGLRSPQETTDPTLRALPESSLSVEELHNIIAGMGLFRINGLESSNAWITVDESGTLHTGGVVNGSAAWLLDGTLYYGFTLNVEETLSGVRVVHGIPLVVTPNTEIYLSGEVVADDDFETFLIFLCLYYADAVFTLQDGWFQAERLSFSPREPEPTDWNARIEYGNLTGDTLKTTGFMNGYWLDIRNNQSSTLEVKPVSMSQSSIENLLSVCILDRIGTALICHSFDINFDSWLPKPSFWTEPSTPVEFILRNGKLILVE